MNIDLYQVIRSIGWSDISGMVKLFQYEVLNKHPTFYAFQLKFVFDGGHF